MDCETEGLDEGPLPYVIALYDTRSNTAQKFLSDGRTDAHILQSLLAMQNSPILTTFNGTQFDFRMLAAACSHPSDQKSLARLALTHVDIMLQFATSNGYFSSLDSFAAPTLGHAKTGSGATVKDDWEAGFQTKVADYCADDARLTALLYDHGAAKGYLLRTPKSKPDVQRRWALGVDLWQPAAVCLRNPKKATFMDNPPNVAAMADWTLRHLQ